MLILLSDFNKNVKKDQLELAKSGSFHDKKALARDININNEVQLILANDPSIWVKGALASNKFINKNTQFILANDKINPLLERGKNNWVKSVLAQNPAIDLEIQKLLAKDDDIFVRTHLSKTNFTKKRLKSNEIY